MLKVLQVVSGLGGGGVSSLLKNYYQNMDHCKVTFDFIVHGTKIYMNEKYFMNEGSNIFHITPASISIVKHFLEIDKIIKRGHYDVIHIHQGGLSWPILFIALVRNVKVRIAHSHIAYEGYLTPKRKFYAFLSKLFSTELWACGMEAGRSAWGKSKFDVLNNAVNPNIFAFSSEKRAVYRKKLGISDSCKCIIHIGRYTAQKNHSFIIEIAKELKRRGQEYKLFLIGDGPDFEVINQRIDEAELRDIIVTLGLRNDVEDIISAMDIMILPSLYEGLPVAMIEAQCNGLPIIASDVITTEVSILSNVEYIPLSSPELWVDAIYNSIGRIESDVLTKIQNAGYNIFLEGPKLTKKYYEISEKEW